MAYFTRANTDDHFMVKQLSNDALEGMYLSLRAELGYNKDHWTPSKGDDSEEIKAKKALYDMISSEYCTRKSLVNTTMVSDILWAKVIEQSDKGESGRPDSSKASETAQGSS